MEINNYLSVIRAHKLLIKANMNKLPKYFEHMYDSTDDELKDELTTYKKDGIINGKYYGLLESAARFINKYDLDTSIVKNSTLSLINKYHRIKSLNKACFNEPEEMNAVNRANEMSEINYSEQNEWSDQSEDEKDYESEHSDEHEINTSTSKKPIITDKEHENDLRIILKQAIKNKDRELIITTMELLKQFEENKSNTSTAAAPITNIKTPSWLIP